MLTIGNQCTSYIQQEEQEDIFHKNHFMFADSSKDSIAGMRLLSSLSRWRERQRVFSESMNDCQYLR